MIFDGAVITAVVKMRALAGYLKRLPKQQLPMFQADMLTTAAQEAEKVLRETRRLLE